MLKQIYLDHNATTPLDPRVRELMLPWFGEGHGNPSSAHSAGRIAKQAVQKARSQVASLLGGSGGTVVFTSSGTEANNGVIFAVARQHQHQGHLVVSCLEHPSIRAAATQVTGQGIDVTELAPGPDGRISVDAVAGALRDDTRLVCLMTANNELGTIQPVAEVSALCRQRGIPVLTDAVQAAGKVPVDVEMLGVDYLVIGGHKFHGPLGIAALWVRKGAEIEPLLVGAPQESGMRAGTENVPGIVGLGAASALAEAELAARHGQLSALRDAFEEGLAAIPGAVVHCVDSPRIPHTSHVAFLGVSGHQLMMDLDALGVAVSTGSACFSGNPLPSRTLLKMGIEDAEALASLRISFGITNTRAEVDRALEILAQEVARLRST